ncbi:phosphodiester glycosidase family protein [Promicromonospora kroppenstedtii]|uniref:Phosphodiester glycosidase family protein n=1 Tax=Promicromonospora kroppenstedtii TaxID=440482 RepID=A0ABW7XI37_9MICO
MRPDMSSVRPKKPRGIVTKALTCTVTAAFLVAPSGAAFAAPLLAPEDVPRDASALSAPVPFANAPLVSGASAEKSGEVTPLDLDDNGTAIVTRREERRIAPGLELTRFARLGENGWLSGEVLVADLGAPGADGVVPKGKVQVGYVGPEHVAGNATVSQMAAARGAIAAINGDYFDINNSGAALGASVDDGRLLKSASPGRERSVVIGSDPSGSGQRAVGRLAQIFLEGSVSWAPADDGARTEVPVSGLNVTAVPPGGVAVFDAGWGTFTRTRPLAAGEQGIEVTVSADGTVTTVGQPAGGQLPDGTRAVVARPGAAADALATLRPGDRIDLAYGLREDAGDVAVAIGGGVEDPLLEDGEVTSATGDHVELRHPRTAVGFDESGTRAYFVVVDGRQTHSIGMNLYELGGLMAQLGADDAINLDGGGSSEMVARLPGDAANTILNSPSDGFERADANGLGLYVPAGSGRVAAYDVRTTVPADDADRVFPGLHRTLVGKGYDDTMGPVATEPSSWRARDGAVASVRDGVVTGRRAGSTTVTAASLSRWGLATGTTEVEVLGDLVRTGVDTPVVGLEDADATAPLVLTGYDAQGFTAPIEARDVTVTAVEPGEPRIAGVRATREPVAELVPAADGSFEVRALAEVGGTTFELSVPGPDGTPLTTRVAVTVSLEEDVVADFADAASWTSANDRAPGGTLAPAAGHDGAAGLRMTYDFTRSTATRGQYAVLPESAAGGRELPGAPRAVTMWVDGDGHGAWLRLQVRQGDGVVTQLDGPEVTWTGWRQVTFPVPDGVAFPLKLQRVRALETTAGEQYTGALTLSSIAAQVPPAVDAPEAPRVEDAVVAADGGTDDAPLRVAVLSDAQFVARDPESGAVAGARSALREIVADGPDLLVINGDLVDEAAPEDFDLARRVLTEELADADFPWYYLPGNHEVMGGSIANFEEEFGERTRVLDVPTPGRAGGTTRLVMLDSSAGRLGADFAQVRMLREALDDAATDRAVTGVVVFAHHPLDDPLPTKASQLTDRLEADTLRGWFEDFEERSGKSVASVGSHVGVFHASTQDGVPYLVNGNSGKSPASTPADGGFTGWSMLGVRPAAGKSSSGGRRPADPWLTWEVNTRAEQVTLSGPESLRVGGSAPVSAVVVQDGSREVPVAWPVSASWGGPGVCVTDEQGRAALRECSRRAALALDPATHELTALRPGRATVTVTVNGTRGELMVTTSR